MSVEGDPGFPGVVANQDGDNVITNVNNNVLNTNQLNKDINNDNKTSESLDSIEKEESRKDPINKYNACSFNNIYKVIIENKIKINDKYISVLKVAELVNKNSTPNTISNIRKVNRYQVIVSFNNKDAANNLVLKPDIFDQKGYKVYIPLFYTTRIAVVRNIDVDYDEKTLLDNIDSRQFVI